MIEGIVRGAIRSLVAMDTPAPSRSRLSAAQILSPRSVAIIGASNDESKFGGRVVRQLLKFGYQGKIIPVNPRSDRVLGLQAFQRISAHPESADVALVAVSPDQVIATCQECADAGVGCCIIITTGFAELDSKGRQKEDALRAIVKSTGMRILGPNCMGYLSPYLNLALTSSVVFDEGNLISGDVALISQSGGLMVSLYDRASTAGIGFSFCVSLGNQCDLDACDFMEAMLGDQKTKAVCVYMEQFKDISRFLKLADRYANLAKPLLLYKAGRTKAGTDAALSHTASVAGSYKVLEAVARQHGVLLMDDPDDMIRAASCLVRWGRPSGIGIGLISTSGGSVTVSADKVAERGLQLASLSNGTSLALQEYLLPSYSHNPVDLGGAKPTQLSSDHIAGKVTEVLIKDENVSLVFAALNTSRPYTEICVEIANAAMRGGKPFVLLFTPGVVADKARKEFRQMNCPYFDSLDSAVRVSAAVIEYSNLLITAQAKSRSELLVQPSHGLKNKSIPKGRLTGPEVMSILASQGIPTVEERFCPTLEDARAAAVELGFPVVQKIVCRELTHKSDVGAVRLNILNDGELKRAWREIHAAALTAMPNAKIEGVSVQAMKPGGLELLIGIRRESGLGNVLVVGAGGTLVELLPDVQIAETPVRHEAALALLQKLRIWSLLSGWRGKPRLDIEAVADVMVKMSLLANSLGPMLRELEINPLIVSENNVVAVDARATIEA